VVFTFPKVLRVFFRHDRSLYGELCKLVYSMMQRLHTEAAGRAIQGAAVISYASAEDFVRWNPHEAKTHLSRLIKMALEGEEIIIAKGRRVVVKLTPIAGKGVERKADRAKGFVWMADDFDAPLEAFKDYKE
jgi:antitoxin (DNA-binding transcriptional repressor) of toxin-antitoxin stability system